MTAIVDALEILAKIDDRRLSTEVIIDDPARSAPGGRSHLSKHRRFPDGLHVVTTHRIYDAHGDTTHRHGKDIVLGEIRFVVTNEPEHGPVGTSRSRRAQ